MALISTLVETFSAASIDTSKWTLVTLGNGCASNSQSTGQLVITTRNLTYPGVGGVDGTFYQSAATYVLRDSAIYVNVPQVADGTADTEVRISDGTSTSYVRFINEAGTLHAQRSVSGTKTELGSVAHSNTTHAWLKIAHATGTGIVYSTSPDGVTWTVLVSDTTVPAFLDAAYVLIGASTYDSTSTTQPAKFDNVNTSGVVAAVPRTAGAAVGRASRALVTMGRRDLRVRYNDRPGFTTRLGPANNAVLPIPPTPSANGRVLRRSVID